MAIFRMIVVARTEQVGGHDAAAVPPILTVIAFAQLYARNFGNGIGLISWLQRAGQQQVLPHGLGG